MEKKQKFSTLHHDLATRSQCVKTIFTQLTQYRQKKIILKLISKNHLNSAKFDCEGLVLASDDDHSPWFILLPLNCHIDHFLRHLDLFNRWQHHTWICKEQSICLEAVCHRINQKSASCYVLCSLKVVKENDQNLSNSKK